MWTTPAFDAAGNSYWGSVDFYAFSLDPAGNQRWQTFTPGYLTSSPALGSDGTVYIGSFDRSLHALDPATGAERWAFPTADHIYSSPALASDAAGNTTAIYIGSADGSVYAVAPDGHQLWRYDTGDPVRSSPVIGRAPKGDGKIVYVGSSNGSLYALDAETGERRWSFDTTPKNAGARRPQRPQRLAGARQARRLHRRRARPGLVRPLRLLPPLRQQALHHRPGPGVQGERRPGLRRSPRAGRRCAARPRRCRAATTLAARLVVRRDGTTVDAAIDPAVSVTSKPGFTFTTELSGDGHFLFIRPDGILKPDTDYRVSISGVWTGDGANGTFSKTLHYVTEAASPQAHGARDSVGHGAGDRAHPPGAARAVAAAERQPDRLRLLRPDRRDDRLGAREARAGPPADVGDRRAQDQERSDARPIPTGGFAFPLYGPYNHNQVALNTSQVSLQFSFGPVPLRSLDFRGATHVDGSFAPGASLYGQVTCADVPNYSAQLRIAGVCNDSDTLASYGTFLSDGYDGGGANAKPKGVSAGGVELTAPTASEDGAAVASLRLRAAARATGPRATWSRSCSSTTPPSPRSASTTGR